jgi:hypothetical protein
LVKAKGNAVVDLISRLKENLHRRELTEGGFQEKPGGDFRPDATAWSIVALAARGDDNKSIDHSRQRLAMEQKYDGRVSITAEYPEAFWPTALAVLAWQGAVAQREAQRQAIHFLLNTFGAHGPRQDNSPLGHDPAIPGWPWVNATHSWVEPTALALLALSISDKADHLRARQAARMLLDRQLTSGGWNYGNTRVYGQELRPMPAFTGLALQALAGHTEATEIKKSLAYLESIIDTTHTPFSLAWGLLGLSAWRKRPVGTMKLISASLDRQLVLGEYPTTHLSLLFLAALAKDGLLGLLTDRKGQHFG